MPFYKIKVWLTTLVVSPFLILLSGLPDAEELAYAMPIIFTIIPFSFIFSLPLLIIFALTHSIMRRFNNGKITIKITLSIISLLGIFAYLYLATGKIITTPAHIYTLSYSASILFSIWFYKLDEAVKNHDEENSIQ